MNISFDKQISSLEREILLKSVEIHDSGDDFQFELNKFFSQKEIIAIAPRCIRCNMCVDQCPVDAGTWPQRKSRKTAPRTGKQRLVHDIA